MAQKSNQPPKTLPVPALMLTGGSAACVAELCTIPLDTAKVRLQIQGESGLAAKYKGVFSALQVITKEEGFFALWSGIYAGFQRQIVFGSLRLGLYEPMRDFIAGGNQNATLLQKIMTGLATGTIAMSVASPTDLVKIRMQAQGKWKLIDPSKIKYTGVIDAYKKILAQEGFLSFWTGVGPNIVRNAVINASELATYDQCKETVIRNKYLPDNMACHFLCSFIAGFTATVIGSPVDVIKTRIMNADKTKGEQYKGIFDCVVKTLKNEGPLAFYKGFNANAQRIISWNIVMFVTWGQFKKIYSDFVYGKKGSF